MARKRSPGGGRKPQGDIAGKTATFSTRITAATRLALDVEAKDRGQSVSQVAEKILRDHFERSAASIDRPTRALCYLIGEAAHQVSGFRRPDGVPEFHWRSDPFMFQALTLAIQRILEFLRPDGELHQPKVDSRIKELFDSPQKRADIAFSIILTALQTYDSSALEAGDKADLKKMGSSGALHVRQLYGFESARRDLELGAKK